MEINDKVKPVVKVILGALEGAERRLDKLDQMARGASFFLSGRRKGGMCLPEILKWYIKGFD